jgi:MFS family permease
MLFFWLLWGDVCFTLMETVVPSILPLKLENLGASNTVIGLLMNTIPMTINCFTNPIISFKSDRFRSRWGRRIPFIVVTMPVLLLFLWGVGVGDDLGWWLREHVAVLSRHFSPNTVALAAVGVMMTLFSFANMFVASVFWYLFNDVVPEHLLARFMSWFRTVSVGATFLYDTFIFQFAKDYAAQIFLGAGVLYFVGFGAMCLKVKEGEYPPAPKYEGGGVGPIAAIKTYAKECHSRVHYLYMFLIALGTGGTIAATVAYMNLYYLSTGLDTKQTGYVRGAGDVALLLMYLVAGWLADRVHPIRVVIGGLAFQAFVVCPAMLVWLFWWPDQSTTYWVWMGLTIALMSPAGAMIGMLDPPLFMRIFPRSRYGQFCSSNALWRSASVIVGGILLGMILDWIAMKTSKRTAFACLPFWYFASYCVMLAGAVLLYRSWKRHGGDESYVPPGENDGMAELADAATSGTA